MQILKNKCLKCLQIKVTMLPLAYHLTNKKKIMDIELQADAIEKSKKLIHKFHGTMPLVQSEIAKNFPSLSKDEIHIVTDVAFDLVAKDFEESR